MAKNHCNYGIGSCLTSVQTGWFKPDFHGESISIANIIIFIGTNFDISFETEESGIS